MTVSLLEIFAAARAHAAPLAAESAGYLLLAVADKVVAAPRVVAADEVELSADGSVRLRHGANLPSQGAEQAVRRLLARALEVSSSVGPGLRRAAERADDAGLPTLVRELEVALIPVNRSAAKRALSRLHRETERARDAGKLDPLLRVEEAAAAAVVTAPVAAAPALTREPAAAIAAAAEFPEPPPAVMPLVAVTTSTPKPAPPVVELTLTPEPQLAVGEPALTKPEPVVLRAKERGSTTPRLGTVVTAQTLPGEESDRTERAPDVAFAPEELDLSIDVVLDESEALTPQPLRDPEPSHMPDVLTAMLELHTGFDADEAPTRIREVVTELRPRVEAVAEEPAVSLPEPVHESALSTPEPEVVEDTWLTQSSLESIPCSEQTPAPLLFVSERVAPELHEALTWDPGPVVSSLPSPRPPPLLLVEPLPEPSPYAPAVLPVRCREVSELLDSFHVTGAAEERELRSALKEMAGLELTPMPHPRIEER